MTRKRTILMLACGLLAMAAGGPASAQTINKVSVLNFDPSVSPFGILTVDTARTMGNFKFHAGVYVSYANDPLRATLNGNTVYKPVNHQVAGDVVLALGIWKYFELGVHFPAVFYQTDSGDPGPVGLSGYSQESAVPGDLRIAPKIRFWRNTSHGFGLAVVPQFSVHTGFEDDNAGEKFMTFAPKLVVDYTFAQGTVIAFNAGYRLRKDVEVGNLRVGDEFYYSLGTEINVFRKQLSVLALVQGAVGLKDAEADPDSSIDKEEIPLEAGGGLRYRAPFGLIVTAGATAGVTDGWATPDFRVFLGLGYATPTKEYARVDRVPDKDSDSDGLIDRVDKCPQKPEDKDGVQDEDGCPDPDNDKDGVCDDNQVIQADVASHAAVCKGSDRCPAKPEDKDGFEDEDGCPEPDNDKDGLCDDNPDIQQDVAKYSQVCTGKDGCTNKAEDKDGFKDKDGCPDPDNDGDGVCDNNPEIQKNLAAYESVCKGSDGCPEKAEDKDGFEDADGCPEPDNDKDGFCDSHPDIQNNLAKYSAVCKGKDQCPMKPETINGYKDDDGCPDKGKPRVKVVAKRIVIMDKIYFATNKARILRRSYRILTLVATVLKTYVAIQKVRIEGHTDERGNDEFNMKLSTRRANSVRDFLIQRGIDAARLVAVGFGETRPVQSGCRKMRRRARKKCWAGNRRVEFNIVTWAK